MSKYIEECAPMSESIYFTNVAATKAATSSSDFYDANIYGGIVDSDSDSDSDSEDYIGGNEYDGYNGGNEYAISIYSESSKLTEDDWDEIANLGVPVSGGNDKVPIIHVINDLKKYLSKLIIN